MQDYPFNDDLLLKAADQELAKSLYPNIFPALDHPELRAAFLAVDKVANAAKRRSRILGLVAVALVALALLGASAEPLYHGHSAATAIAVMSGACGLVGALLGFFGVLFAGSKRRWLEGRLLTERLRQFHFQSLVAWAPTIIGAADSGDWRAYVSDRKVQFEKFKRDVMVPVATIYDTVVVGEDSASWLFPVKDGSGIEQSSNADEYFQAYERLRIERQLRFSALKLRRDRSLFSSFPVSQVAVLGTAALLAVLGLVVIHAAVVIGVIADAGEPLLALLHVIAIWLAVAALAVRTLEEGFQPHREIERYRGYGMSLQNLHGEFERASTAARRLDVMKDLEELSFMEMVAFLKANHEARFVM